MNKTFMIIIAVFLVNICIAQEIKEINPPELSSEFNNLIEFLDENENLETKKKIAKLNEAFPKIKYQYEKVILLFWYYTGFYSETEDYDSILNKLAEGQKQGISYPYMHGERSWPAWIENVSVLNGFEEFNTINDSLKKLGQENAQLEYFTVLPDAYDPDSAYPLLIILHGGTGSHVQTWRSWQNDLLSEEYICVYPQGDQFMGTYFRRYPMNDYSGIKAIYTDVIKKYNVDTSQVFLGGPSLGGYHSMRLGMKNEIPVDGLILMFPVIPRNYDSTFFKHATANNIGVVIITGENDFGIVRQKKFATDLDQHGIRNRFIVFPEKGHEYPDDFEKEIKLSMKFLKNEN